MAVTDRSESRFPIAVLVLPPAYIPTLIWRFFFALGRCAIVVGSEGAAAIHHVDWNVETVLEIPSATTKLAFIGLDLTRNLDLDLEVGSGSFRIRVQYRLFLGVFLPPGHDIFPW